MTPDRYVIQALVTPLAVASLPLGVVAGLLGWPASPTLAVGLIIGGPSLLAILGADVVRSLGRDLQARLWDEDGGSPTTLAFLNSDETAADRRRRLQAVTGITAANDRASIERATSALRDLAADTSRFPRVPIANANYGRARHLLALRTWGLAVAGIADLMVLVLLLPVPLPDQVIDPPVVHTAFALVLCVALTAFWMFFPTKRRLRRAGDDYADRLLAALDVLSSERSQS